MNSAFYLRREDRVPRWYLFDAKGKVVGRLATELADCLRGKKEAIFAPHTDSDVHIVVINAAEVVFTGNKRRDKIYQTYSGYMGGLKELTAQQLFERNKPERIIEQAVKRMLPKNRLAAKQITRLKVYAGPEHPHKAQLIGFGPEQAA